MRDDKRQQSYEPVLALCALCLEVRADVHVNVCMQCVEDTLWHRLPLLKRVLEKQYGRYLDAWLKSGRFVDAFWEIGTDFEVGQEHLRRFLSDVIGESLRKEAVTLVLPRSGGWIPIAVDRVASVLFKQCGEAFRCLVTEMLRVAIQQMPTEMAERELIEVASGDMPSYAWRKGYALELAAYTTGNPLPPSAAVLLTLRYGTNKFGQTYICLREGEIDPVWRECADFLPPEIVSLIPEDENSWM